MARSPDMRSFGTANQGRSGLGLTTGSTWHGNTAFGPAGGMATGYGTRSFGNNTRMAGVGGTSGWSNFRNPNGSPMFGNVGGARVNAANTGQALRRMNMVNQSIGLRNLLSGANSNGVSGRPAFGPRPQPGMLAPEVEPGPIPTPAVPFQFSKPPYTIDPSVAGQWNNYWGKPIPQDQNFVQGYLGDKQFTGAYANSFYGSPRLGTPNIGSMMTGYGYYNGPGPGTNFGAWGANQTNPGTPNYNNNNFR